MNKVFLYLYPIEEYTKVFLLNDNELYEEWNIKRPLPILNEAIQKRYRENGYQIVFVLYPDKKIYGVDLKKDDKIIYTDILFSENSATDEHNKEKKGFIPKYPSERMIIDQLGNIDNLVVGGYHFSDCVKRVAEWALNSGIDTLVDLDLTDLFFSLYKKKDYFKIEEYSPKRYKNYIIKSALEYGENFAERQFNIMYQSPIYGFYEEDKKTK